MCRCVGSGAVITVLSRGVRNHKEQQNVVHRSQTAEAESAVITNP